MTDPASSPSAEIPSIEVGQLLTAEQVAARWQVPKSHVYRLGREGKLPTVSLGKYKRWRLLSIEAFEQEGGVE